ncbi:MAG: DUF6498-containing protein [Bacteroidota bacterium]
MNIPTPSFTPLGSHWAMQLILNLVSLFGVIFFDWNVFSLFYFFFLETVALSFFDGLKIAFAQGDEEQGPHFMKGIRFLLRRSLILAFYLIFILTFVGVLMSSKQGKGYEWLHYFLLIEPTFRFTVLSLVVVKSVEFFYFYFYLNERKYVHSESLNKLIDSRIIVIHVVIVLGAFSFQFFENKFGIQYGIISFATVFVLLKIGADVMLHRSSAAKSKML